MYAEADVPVSVLGRFSGVNPHPHTQLRAVGPLELGEGTLAVDGCRHGVLGASEGDEERVALGVDLVSAVSLESVAEQSLMLRERLPVQRAEPLQQAGRSLDVQKRKVTVPVGRGPAAVMGQVYYFARRASSAGAATGAGP